MADTYLNPNTLEGIFQDLTLSMLDIDASGWEDSAGSQFEDSAGSQFENVGVNPYSLVRISWPTYGSPAWKITDTVAFIRITESDHQINKHRDMIYSDLSASLLKASMGKTRVISVAWTIYGPDSYDWAQTILDKMFLQEHHNALAQYKVYLVPDISAPRRLPEIFQGQWWERTDISMLFNALTIRNFTIAPIDSVNIHLRRDDDSDRLVPIEETTIERSSFESSQGSEFEDGGSSSFEPMS